MYSNSKIGHAISKSLITPAACASVSRTSSNSSANRVSSSKYFNYLSPFQVIFGFNAKQTLQTIVIKKSDLNLTQLVNNRAETLLAALAIRLLSFGAYSNDSIQGSLWGIGFSEGYRIATLVVLLNNLMVYIEPYEIEDLTDTINPNNY